jgi:DNA-binding GntR family transcriptional regulator
MRPIHDEAPSVLEVAYRRLREAIMAGAFPPGQHLRQEDIAQRFGISRGPAREALNRLAAEGFVQLRPRRGYVVESFDPAEVQDIFDTRMMLEERAGYLATLRRTDADVAAVERLLLDLEAARAQEPFDIGRWAACNRAFHTRLVETSGRRHLCRMLMLLRDSVERYVRFEITMMSGASEEHRAIYEAFRRGDAETVGRISRQHCANISASIIARLKAKP